MNIEMDKGDENFAKCCHANDYELMCLVSYDIGVKLGFGGNNLLGEK